MRHKAKIKIVGDGSMKEGVVLTPVSKGATYVLFKGDGILNFKGDILIPMHRIEYLVFGEEATDEDY